MVVRGPSGGEDPVSTTALTVLTVLAVGGGGFLGGLGRWILARYPGGLRGTFLANLLAVAVLGAVIGHGGWLALAWGTGFAGTLSTWSTLAREIGGLLKARRFLAAAGYATATLTAGLAVAWLSVQMSG